MNKYINSFESLADYNEYISSENAFYPNIAYVEGETKARILASAPESPYEMRFFNSNGDQIDTDRYQFELDIQYAIKLYDKDNEDYVATTDWSPEISYDQTEVRAEEDAKSNQYTFTVSYDGYEHTVNFKAIVDRVVVDEDNYHFIVGL